MDTMQPTASPFMTPNLSFSSTGKAKPNVSARLLEDADEGATRSVATMGAPRNFPIAKEHRPDTRYYQKQSSPAYETPSLPTISVLDVKEPAKPAKRSSWRSPVLKKLPRYFPLERTNRRINVSECSFDDLLLRISDGLRVMSIQAKYFDRPVRSMNHDAVTRNGACSDTCTFHGDRQASAALLTPENVELYLALWDSDDSKQVIVEVQRRRGDCMLFHQFASHLLDAASGNLDTSLFSNNAEGSLLYLRNTEQILRNELSRVAPAYYMNKESIVALEIVSDLVQKDRRDARQLGMEGVCILANVRKTTLTAAIRTSRAILLGDQESQASQGLHEILLGIIQKKTIDGQDQDMGGEYYEDSDDEQYFLDQDEEIQDYSPEYKEEITLLFNLALDAVSHALEVLTNFGIQDPNDSSSQADASSLSNTSWIIESFLGRANEVSGTELLSTLLLTLQRAYLNPHNAWLAAKCLRFICAACPSAAERTRALGAEQSTATALAVGIASHAKLESECLQLQSVWHADSF